MRIAVVGAGAREHALLWTLAQSSRVERLFAVPGNAGTAAIAEPVTGIPPTDGKALAAWAGAAHVDLTVVGPEAPLVAGVADQLAAEGLQVFGPTAAAARIEGSKAFAKEVMAAAGVPTSAAAVFDDADAARRALDRFGPPWVVKADGLAAGKGVTVTTERDVAERAIAAALVERVHGDAGGRLLLEEYLDGPELSLFAVCDGRNAVPLAPARDYKRAHDGDAGPNTGGMGAYSPLGDVPAALVDEVTATVLEPTLAELARRGAPFRGLLYAGLALTASGPKVVEFNCRFGDPETEVVLPRLQSDLAPLLAAAAAGDLAGQVPRWDPRACVTVVMASEGYPGEARTGVPINGLPADGHAGADSFVFHAATTVDEDGRVVAAGGRVLAVCGMGADVSAARGNAYEAVERISFDGGWCRRDIAAGVS